MKGVLPVAKKKYYVVWEGRKQGFMSPGLTAKNKYKGFRVPDLSPILQREKHKKHLGKKKAVLVIEL